MSQSESVSVYGSTCNIPDYKVISPICADEDHCVIIVTVKIPNEIYIEDCELITFC